VELWATRLRRKVEDQRRGMKPYYRIFRAESNDRVVGDKGEA
jgi:hypothetical protein